MQLIKDGRMHITGLAAIETATQNGGWTALDDVDNLVVPRALQKALNQNEEALNNFSAFPKSSKRTFWSG